MPLFVWTDQLTLGIASIDRQHRQLVDILNAMHDALARGKGKAHVTGALVDLTTYAANHFAHEEELMRKHGYDDYARHKAVHDGMARHVGDLRQRFLDGQATTVEVLTFVSDWLRKHILETDRRYATVLAPQLAPGVVESRPAIVSQV